MTTRATIEDVAKAAGVSVATVSRALRDLPNVAPATRSRIRQIARRLDYEAHPQAARLASGKTMTIGLVAPLFGLWYAMQVVAGAEEVLSDQGYDLLIQAADTPENRERFLRRAASLRGRVDGLILVDFFASPDQADRLRTAQVPIVTIGDRIEGLPSVTIDNRAGGAMAAEHLIALGHRRIALMTGDTAHGYPSPVPEARAEGYAAALAEAGVDADPDLVVDGGFTVGGGSEAIEALWERPDPPTAVFCLSDEMAMGALARIRMSGRRVPEDLSVVGFDDHDLAHVFGLTTVQQPVRAMGRAATRDLLAAIAAPDADPTHRNMAMTLIPRASTARLE